MKKKSLKFKLSIIAVIIALVVPLPVMAADKVTFSNFNFTMNAYEDKTKTVISNNKNNANDVWKYSITSLTGVGSISSGKVIFLYPSYSGAPLGVSMPATIYSGMSMNTVLSAPYYDSHPSNRVYTLYAKSNDAYGASMNVTVSGTFEP